MRTWRTAAVRMSLVVCVLLLPAAALASEVTGRVTDRSGGVLPRAAVTALNIVTGETHSSSADDEGRFNRSALDIGGAALVVSQFTLYADTRRGRRPSFSDAAAPDLAAPLVAAFAAALRRRGLPVETGVFGAHMDVALINDGPVTIILDSATFREPRRK